MERPRSSVLPDVFQNGLGGDCSFIELIGLRFRVFAMFWILPGRISAELKQALLRFSDRFLVKFGKEGDLLPINYA